MEKTAETIKPTLKELLLTDAARGEFNLPPRSSGRRRPAPTFDVDE